MSFLLLCRQWPVWPETPVSDERWLDRRNAGLTAGLRRTRRCAIQIDSLYLLPFPRALRSLPSGDRRPTTDLRALSQIHTFWENFKWLYLSNASSDRLRVCSRVAFSRTAEWADRTAPFPFGSNLRWRPAAILKNFKWPYQRVV